MADRPQLIGTGSTRQLVLLPSFVEFIHSHHFPAFTSRIMEGDLATNLVILKELG